MNKIRITKDENGAVILRFEKREDCERYTVYFRRENGRFKFLISTEKTAVRVNAVEGLCYFMVTGQTSGGRTVNIGTVDTSSLMKRTGFITMGSYNVQKIVERSPKFTADNTVRKISPLAAFFPEKIDNSDAQWESRTFEYIKEKRMAEAGRLLKDTDLSNEEIMNRIGYTDKKQFYSNFKEVYGQTPSSYRKNPLP